jgi:hypothetical protein
MCPRSVSRGVPRRLRASGGQSGEVPRYARHDRMGLSPRASHFLLCRPERSEGSPPGDPVQNEVMRDAVPNEVRDARLALGRTKKDARQDKVGGTFFEQPQPQGDLRLRLEATCGLSCDSEASLKKTPGRGAEGGWEWMNY